MHQIDLIELELVGVQSFLPRQLSPLLNRRLLAQRSKNEVLLVCQP